MGSQGAASLDFGAFPGSSHADLDVATAGVVAASQVEAWIQPKATADHTADEHVVESLKVFGRYKTDGTITVSGVNTNQLNEPVALPVHETSIVTGSATAIAVKLAAPGVGRQGGGGEGTRIYGVWSIGWVWNG